MKRCAGVTTVRQSREWDSVVTGRYGCLWTELRGTWRPSISHTHAFIGRITPRQFVDDGMEFDCIALSPRRMPFLAVANKRGALFFLDFGEQFRAIGYEFDIHVADREERIRADSPTRTPNQSSALLPLRNAMPVDCEIRRLRCSIPCPRTPCHQVQLTLCTADWNFLVCSEMKGLHKTPIARLETTTCSDVALSLSAEMVALWNVKSAAVLFKKRAQMPEGSYVGACAFFAESSVWTLDIKGQIVSWNTKTGEAQCAYNIHSSTGDAFSQMLGRVSTAPSTARSLYIANTKDTVFEAQLDKGELRPLSSAAEEGGNICDIELFKNDVLVICRRRGCHLLDLEREGSLAEVEFAVHEARPFAGRSVALANSTMACLSETGVILLFDLSALLNDTRLQKGHTSAKRRMVPVNPSPLGPRDHCGRNASRTKTELKNSLLFYGGYPSKLRKLVWKELLHLPVSSAAFRELSCRPLPSFKALKQFLSGDSDTRVDKHERRQRRAFVRLIQWCPILAEVAFVEVFARPFVRLFGTDEHLAFEVIATILGNWGWPLLSSYPDPPLQLLSEIGALLKMHDPQLHAALESAQYLRRVVWRLMSTGLSTILFPSDWLLAWDHILTNAFSFYAFMVVSVAKSQRQRLMVAARNECVDEALSIHQSVDILGVIRDAYTFASTTSEIHTPRSTAFRPLRPAGVAYPPLFPRDLHQTGRRLAAKSTSSPVTTKVVNRRLQVRGTSNCRWRRSGKTKRSLSDNNAF